MEETRIFASFTFASFPIAAVIMHNKTVVVQRYFLG